MKKTLIALLSLTLLASATAHANSPIKRKICVFDIIGNVGPVMGAMRDWRTAALEWGLDAELIPFTNEAIAAEDLKAGKCDAALMTGIRGRDFNQYSGTLDSIGGIPSVDHMRIVLQVLAHPSSADKISTGAYSVMGIAPAGAAFVFVNDRAINTLAKAAGKKVAVLEYDRTQSILVAQIGATPVNSDITNFSSKFNNGVVDVIAAPLVAYAPLELYKGLSPNGGIINYPLAQITMQLISRTDRFPQAMMQTSREYFYNNLDQILDGLAQEEKSVDPKWWVDIPARDKSEYEIMMQEARIQLRDQGYYHPEMLGLQRRVRCRIDNARAECVNPVE
ncbi:MAG: putative solute-binding protein [Alcanivoracaceae bacterium]